MSTMNERRGTTMRHHASGSLGRTNAQNAVTTTASVLLIVANLGVGLVSGQSCSEFTIRPLKNHATNTSWCIMDFDEEDRRHSCTKASPNMTRRVLPVAGGNIDTKKPDPYGQCAQRCVDKGLYGTAGIEDGYQCWCSHSQGLQGNLSADQSDCNMMCPNNISCGGFCRINEFEIICPPAPAKPMSGGTIFLMCFGFTVAFYLVGGVVYNRRKGEVGMDVIPHKDFWGQTFRLIREGCLFSALTCMGRAKSAFKVGHSTFTRYEQL
eukprot:m.198809 g.198809  ORF g.198809 m.198809 type:complete len:266 (+) comp20559_c0_seq1:169-966(+)